MSPFQIRIDASLCSAYGACIAEAPEVLTLDAAGIAQARVDQTDDDAVLAAARACPMGAIAVRDLESGEWVA